MALIIPVIFIFVFGFAVIKRVNVYDCFTEGISEAVKFTFSLLPCLAAVFMMCALFEQSGLADMFTRLLSPVFARISERDNRKVRRGQLRRKVRVRVLRLFRNGVLYLRGVLLGAESKKACDARNMRAGRNLYFHRYGVLNM